MEEYLKQLEAKANKALEYATKVLMAMPKLMAKIDSLTEEVTRAHCRVDNVHDTICEDRTEAGKYYESFYEKIEDINDRVDGLMEGVPRIVESINESLKEVQHVPEPKQPKRNQTDYPTYVKVKDLSDKGYLDKEIATEMGIPYTTVRAYLRWTDTQVAKKKQQWDAKKANKPYIEPNDPVIYEEQLVSSSPVVCEEQLSLSIDDEYEQIEAQAKAVEYTHFTNRTIPFTDWTAEDRDNNALDSEHLPTGKDMLVIIRREDAYSMPYAVKELDWSSNANHPIDGWRLATEQESGQYIQRALGLL